MPVMIRQRKHITIKRLTGHLPAFPIFPVPVSLMSHVNDKDGDQLALISSSNFFASSSSNPLLSKPPLPKRLEILLFLFLGLGLHLLYYFLGMSCFS